MSEVSIAELKELVKDLIIAQKETDAKFKETDAKFKETDKRIKQAFELFESQWGRLMESLVEGDLLRILNERGILVNQTSTRRKGRIGNQNFEFDIIAHNGVEIVLVEVKTTLKVKYVKQFIEKLKMAKTFLPEFKNYKIYGAVAYLQEDESSASYAQNNGLFVIRATGDSAAIINDEDFKPSIF